MDVARPAHLGALVPVIPRILGMIRDESNLCWRDWTHSQVVPTKAAQAADESWQQTVQGYNFPTITHECPVSLFLTDGVYLTTNVGFVPIH